jgi:hypothetical protein
LNKNDHEDDGRDEVEHVWLEGQVTFVGNGFVSVDRNAFCGNGTSRKTGQRPLELGDRVRYTKQLNTKRNSHSKFKVIELVLLDDNVGNANAKKNTVMSAQEAAAQELARRKQGSGKGGQGGQGG